MANYGKRNGKQRDGMGTKKNNNNRVKEERKPLYILPLFRMLLSGSG